jgi:hypothetical protein
LESDGSGVAGGVTVYSTELCRTQDLEDRLAKQAGSAYVAYGRGTQGGLGAPS